MIVSKICSHCKEEKSIDAFARNKNTKDGRQYSCRMCQNAIVSKWYKENSEIIRNKRKIRFNNDPEKVRAYFRAKARERLKNPQSRLGNNISRAIRHSIQDGAKSKRHWEDLVGYTVAQLKKHLEKRFTDGMTWDNYGTLWEIDHKVPISVFNFEKPGEIDFRLCWSLKNLQPMVAVENRSKQGRIDKLFQPSLAMEM